MSVHSTKLTPGERLLVWRRREWISQATAACHLAVSTSTYRRYESDEYGIADTPYVQLHRRGRAITCKGANPTLSPAEECVIARRRGGLTQVMVAQYIGRSRWYVNMVENGHLPAGRLIEFFRLCGECVNLEV